MVLDALVAAATFLRSPASPSQAVAVTLTVAALELVLALGLWRGIRWAWWGTVVLMLLVRGWVAVVCFVLLLSADGRSTLLDYLANPSAHVSNALHVLVLVLLLLPLVRTGLRPRSAG